MVVRYKTTLAKTLLRQFNNLRRWFLQASATRCELRGTRTAHAYTYTHTRICTHTHTHTHTRTHTRRERPFETQKKKYYLIPHAQTSPPPLDLLTIVEMLYFAFRQRLWRWVFHWRSSSKIRFCHRVYDTLGRSSYNDLWVQTVACKMYWEKKLRVVWKTIRSSVSCPRL